MIDIEISNTIDGYTDTMYKEQEDPDNSKPVEGSSESDGTKGEQSDNNNEGELKPGDKFYGQINTNVDGKNQKITDLFTVVSNDGKTMEVINSKGEKFKTNPNTINKQSLAQKMEDLRRKQEEEKERRRQERKAKEEQEEFEKNAVDYDYLEPEVKLETLVNAGMTNIWMVGPSGCGKSVMARNLANKIDKPYYCISCGIGTSASEFIGHKFPTREATKFANYYSKPSVILIDEMTALDPAVAQVLNAALANNEIETTTGLVHRHPECIIIATSNTFGNGSNRQYVANNQLDASTIDRFVGATIEIDYSEKFESQYDMEVVEYVKVLRRCIKQNEMRRVASTRMIQAGVKHKKVFIRNWKDLLIQNWTKSEKELLKEFIRNNSLPSVIIRPSASTAVSSFSTFSLN